MEYVKDGEWDQIWCEIEQTRNYFKITLSPLNSRMPNILLLVDYIDFQCTKVLSFIKSLLEI